MYGIFDAAFKGADFLRFITMKFTNLFFNFIILLHTAFLLSHAPTIYATSTQSTQHSTTRIIKLQDKSSPHKKIPATSSAVKKHIILFHTTATSKHKKVKPIVKNKKLRTKNQINLKHHKKLLIHKTVKMPPRKTLLNKAKMNIKKIEVTKTKSTIVKKTTHPTVAQKRIAPLEAKALPKKMLWSSKIKTYMDLAPTPKRHTIVNFVHQLVENIKYSAYKLGGTRFDARRGIYVVDCSSYVDRILKTVHPRAFARLVHYSGSAKPTTRDFYQFFNNLTDEPQTYWDTVDDISKLRPGDLLVFRYRNEPENITKGHIVIVMDNPQRVNDTYRVRISDSAPVRHSNDTRMRRVSGIGIGTMLFKVHPKTYQPFAYAWGVHSKWEKNVRFAMARPLELRS